MVSLREAKEFLRVDDDSEDVLISSLIMTAKDLVEQIIRKRFTDFDDIPETISQAMLIVIATLYEERQVGKDKEGIGMTDVLDLVRRMLFAYREEKF